MSRPKNAVPPDSADAIKRAREAVEMAARWSTEAPEAKPHLLDALVAISDIESTLSEAES